MREVYICSVKQGLITLKRDLIELSSGSSCVREAYICSVKQERSVCSVKQGLITLKRDLIEIKRDLLYMGIPPPGGSMPGKALQCGCRMRPFQEQKRPTDKGIPPTGKALQCGCRMTISWLPRSFGSPR